MLNTSRLEVIDVVGTLSTGKVKAGEEGNDSFKFSRFFLHQPQHPCISWICLFQGKSFSITEHQEQYREDCQRIFEVQNKVLASDEVLLLTAHYWWGCKKQWWWRGGEEEEEDLNEMGRNIEKMLSNKKTNNQFSDNISTEDFLTQTSETFLSETRKGVNCTNLRRARSKAPEEKETLQEEHERNQRGVGWCHVQRPW